MLDATVAFYSFCKTEEAISSFLWGWSFEQTITYAILSHSISIWLYSLLMTSKSLE